MGTYTLNRIRANRVKEKRFQDRAKELFAFIDQNRNQLINSALGVPLHYKW